ncbi:hypothetical protein IQ274_35620 [Nostoc sp. LEGE 12447]|jgi:hypothetical protein|uniref:hypothetical protein n=1 Tax=Nostoc sp. LEGE 12447 TaxID=1828640 RepID=UPI0018832A9E|nr:hypothetical protein [Nostoc sp. LEGE 12447]MBE9003345.1 hypothetical protein [Nostoc sp. LEGE 12447]
MTQSQPSLPQPQLERDGITSEQYLEFTPEKLELSDGYLGYGGRVIIRFALVTMESRISKVFERHDCITFKRSRGWDKKKLMIL